MKTKFFTLFLALVASVGSIFASYGEVDGIWYNFYDWESTAGVIFAQNEKYSGSITIPSEVSYNGKIYKVTSIEVSAFSGCTSLTSITIPNSVSSIENDAFYNCTSLTTISIPNSVASIKSGAFSGCNSLISIELPNGIASIESHLFEGCLNLSSFKIPASITSIGFRAFADCKALTFVEIPNSVTSIEWHAFTGCIGLTSIVVEKENSIYDSRDNCNAIIETASNTLIAGCQNTIIPNSVTSIERNAFDDCSSLTSIEIPNSVTSIGNGAFSGCSGLSSVVIPNSITRIEGLTFYGCSNLSSVEIPNSVTVIRYEVFSGCTSLSSITIPNSVTDIGGHTFEGCSSLKYVISLATTPPYLSESVFADVDCSKIPLYVPKESTEAYKAADQWKDFNPILEYGTEGLDLLEDNYDNSSKILQNGNVYILRGDHTYTLIGQEVK